MAKSFGSYSSAPRTTGLGQGSAQVFTASPVGLDASGLGRGIENLAGGISQGIQQKRAEEAAKKKAELERKEKWATELAKEGASIPKLVAARETLYGEMERELEESEEDPEAIVDRYLQQFKAIHQEDIRLQQEMNSLIFDPEKSGLSSLRTLGEDGEWKDGAYIADELLGSTEISDEERELLLEGGTYKFLTNLKSQFSPEINTSLTMASDKGFGEAAFDIASDYFKQRASEGMPVHVGTDGRIDIYRSAENLTPQQQQELKGILKNSPTLQKAHKWEMFQKTNTSPAEYDVEAFTTDYSNQVDQIVSNLGSQSAKTYTYKRSDAERGIGKEPTGYSITVTAVTDAKELTSPKKFTQEKGESEEEFKERVIEEQKTQEGIQQALLKSNADFENLRRVSINPPKPGTPLKPISLGGYYGGLSELIIDEDGNGIAVLSVETSQGTSTRKGNRASTTTKNTGYKGSTSVAVPITPEKVKQLEGFYKTNIIGQSPASTKNTASTGSTYKGLDANGNPIFE